SVVARTVTMAAVVYLLFLATWGLNYRRVPLAAKLEYKEEAVSPASVRDLVQTAVLALNELYRPAHAGDAGIAGIDPALSRAFAQTEAALGISHPAREAQPKT